MTAEQTPAAEIDFLAELLALAAEDDAPPAPVAAPVITAPVYVCQRCGSDRVAHGMTMPAHRRHAATHYGVCFFCDGGVAERRLSLVKSV
jgi:hypothetical protein